MTINPVGPEDELGFIPVQVRPGLVVNGRYGKCHTHHLLVRRRNDGGIEKVVSPPPHNVLVLPRNHRGNMIYSKWCPYCGRPLEFKSRMVNGEVEVDLDQIAFNSKYTNKR